MNEYIEFLREKYVPEDVREKAKITTKELSKDMSFARAIVAKITKHLHPDKQPTEARKHVMRAIQSTLNKIVNKLKGLA